MHFFLSSPVHLATKKRHERNDLSTFEKFLLIALLTGTTREVQANYQNVQCSPLFQGKI